MDCQRVYCEKDYQSTTESRHFVAVMNNLIQQNCFHSVTRLGASFGGRVLRNSSSPALKQRNKAKTYQRPGERDVASFRRRSATRPGRRGGGERGPATSKPGDSTTTEKRYGLHMSLGNGPAAARVDVRAPQQVSSRSGRMFATARPSGDDLEAFTASLRVNRL
ncbi:hypothetical protein EVAR_40819_1 [Eumeta japonica]|uniref:Uncharacterized protein n=1 Tax=Eumeta variegata TaxID=151549 RepID=A0A4C1WJE2_EUMVA|nr:hypothetical protein EVAR_40819_1 [Eumeta japonica]